MNKGISAGVLLAFMLFCAPAKAQWYLGAGLGGLHSEREDNSILSAKLDFRSPRLYGGYRFND